MKVRTVCTAPPIFVAAGDVAQMLGLTSASSFLGRRARLEETLGFPTPVPWSKRPMMWRRESVQRWIDALGEVPAAALDLISDQPDAARRVVMLHQARTS